ncbi:MAG: SGNH/GDSL hydrolase family protein [Planctomycetaceae bacterium]|nr:SGNH/GDSL hydrolase family protein [Planctomycetaceae bacterium]
MMLTIGNISFNSILWFCLSGKPFYIGTTLLVLAAALQYLFHQRKFVYVIYFLYALAILSIIISATPLSPAFYSIWLFSFVLWSICSTKPVKIKTPVFSLFVIVTISAALLETRWHFAPFISLADCEQLYVIGDSVSEGMGQAEEKPWPEIFGEAIGVNAINLAKAGATVETALLKQAPHITNKNSLVILEIGGNDLLNRTSPADFRADADELLRQLRQCRQVVWFELPLLPQYYRYGRIQRQLANRYQIPLIPKSVLASVFQTAGTTSDGIHLTQNGHVIMAAKVAGLIQEHKND